MTRPAPEHQSERKRRNARAARRRYAAGVIAPSIPVTPRTIETLVRRAMAYDRLTRDQAEAAATRRDWVVREVGDVLERFADDWLEK